MHSRTTLRVAWLAGLLAVVAAAPAMGQVTEFRFHRDDILGTSMDMAVWAPNFDTAAAAEAAAVDEIERLRKVLSTYDPASEISTLNLTAEPMKCSPDLLAVLNFGEEWHKRTGGAFNMALGDVITLWKLSEKKNKLPDEALLKQLVDRIQGPAIKIDLQAGAVQRVVKAPLNVDAFAKGYIIDKAVAAAKAKVSAATGMLLAIGGDTLVTGSAGAKPMSPWRIGIADPAHAQDNAPPLTEILVLGRAVTTSGHYERFYKIGDKKYSHIIDPRSGQPASAVSGASAVGRDAMTADALSTTMCVLTPAEGLKLARSVPDAECLIIAADGAQTVSPGFRALEAPKPPAPTTQAATQWPDKFAVNISLTLNPNRRRPYFIVWIEDANKKPVRTLAVWGNELKYLKDLTTWWNLVGSKHRENIKNISKASRQAGHYTLVWDGLDDANAPLPPGSYTVRMEINREKGKHLDDMAATIDCKNAPAKATIPANSELAETEITYGPSGN